MKILSKLLLILGLSLTFNKAIGQTGNFCSGDGQVVSYFCGQSSPGAGWNFVGANCYHKASGRNCSQTANTNPVFDQTRYYQFNSDVAQAGVDPLSHWNNYG